MLKLIVKLIQLFLFWHVENKVAFIPSFKKLKKDKRLIVNNLTNNQCSFPVLRSALCPAEAAGHQLPPPVPSWGLGVWGGGDWYPAPFEEDDAPQQHLQIHPEPAPPGWGRQEYEMNYIRLRWKV